MNYGRHLVVVCCIGFLFLSGAFIFQDQSGEKPSLPSEVPVKTKKMLRDFLEKYRVEGSNQGRRVSPEEYAAHQKEVAQFIEDTIEAWDVEELERKEQYYYGQLLEKANRGDAAMLLYQELAAGSDFAARMSRKELMAEMARRKDFDALERAISSFRKDFSPTPDDADGLFSLIRSLYSYYMTQHDYAIAARLVGDELMRLGQDAAYDSYELASFCWEAFVRAGEKDNFIEIIDSLLDKIGDANELKWTSRELANAKKQISLIDSKAPSLIFTDYLNTAPITLDDLQGKVVLVDFWAHNCGPCFGAFPQMREIYEEYKEKGFEILGVTQFWKSMSNPETNEVEVDIAHERELELMQVLINKHELTWPVAFIEGELFGNDYGIVGIPTFAVIDKKGRVRMLRMGTSTQNEAALREFIQELLAE